MWQILSYVQTHLIKFSLRFVTGCSMNSLDYHYISSLNLPVVNDVKNK